MSQSFGSLVIVSPNSGRILKFRLSRTAIAILVLSCLISFLTVVIIGYTFPPLVTDRQRSAVEKENQELKIRNRNAQIGLARVMEKVSRIESRTSRIEALANDE